MSSSTDKWQSWKTKQWARAALGSKKLLTPHVGTRGRCFSTTLLCPGCGEKSSLPYPDQEESKFSTSDCRLQRHGETSQESLGISRGMAALCEYGREARAAAMLREVDFNHSLIGIQTAGFFRALWNNIFAGRRPTQTPAVRAALFTSWNCLSTELNSCGEEVFSCSEASMAGRKDGCSNSHILEARMEGPKLWVWIFTKVICTAKCKGLASAQSRIWAHILFQC